MESKKIRMYRVISGHHNISTADVIEPRGPKDIGVPGEDESFSRICVAPSLDECITSLNVPCLGAIGLEEAIKAATTPEKKEWLRKNIAILWDQSIYPFTVLTFDIDCDDECLFPPASINHYVPDAHITNEHWIMKPMAPSSVQHLWVYDGKVEDVEVSLPSGVRVRYLKVVGTKWSKTERKPNRSFLKAVNHATVKGLNNMYQR